MRRLSLTLLSAAVASLAFAVPALAEDPSVIDQYQEPIPWGGGNHHTGGNDGGSGGSGGSGSGGGGNGASLPGSTQTSLYGSVSEPVASALETVATSPDLGAPQTTLQENRKQAGKSGGNGKENGDVAAESAPPVSTPAESLSGNPLTDAVSAASDGGSSHVVALLIALLALTVGGAGYAAVAHRRQAG